MFARLAEAVRARAEEGAPEAWAPLWDRLNQLPGEAAALNLDRADVLFSTVAAIQKVRARC